MLQRILVVSITSFLVFFFWSNPASAQENGEDVLAEAKVLTLQSAIARGIQYNLDLQVEELNIPISQENLTIEKAEFDPMIEMGISSLEEKTPTATAFSDNDFDQYRETGGDIGIRKKFKFGLESKLSLKTNRSMNNSSVDTLRPQYHNILFLNFTQPLLRDFGTNVKIWQVKPLKNIWIRPRGSAKRLNSSITISRKPRRFSAIASNPVNLPGIFLRGTRKNLQQALFLSLKYKRQRPLWCPGMSK